MSNRLPTDTTGIDLANWNLADLVVALIAVEFVVKPLTHLLHELGHAAAALRTAPGSVEVIVGRPSSTVEIHFKRLKICFSPLPNWKTGIGGFCKWDPESASARGRLLVYLAGPFATALLLGVFVWAAFACTGMPAWISTTWLLSAFAATLSLLLSIDPRPGKTTGKSSRGDLVRDFPLAVAAYREWREESRGAAQP